MDGLQIKPEVLSEGPHYLYQMWMLMILDSTCVSLLLVIGSEVNTTYVMDSMNTASAYLSVKCKLDIIC